ncbi:MAG: hypothetical protein PHX18_03230 [Candidatus Gastranaerophilales bacterium]|nr:hypothetical protein [Candidatus Gastranaerophilales bacterium]
MNDKEKEEFIANMQKVVQQMRLDDIEDDPSSEFEEFQCDCCAKTAARAGSIPYGDKVFCNECVLFAEIALALGKVKNSAEIIKFMEDKRLEELCEYIKTDITSHNN